MRDTRQFETKSYCGGMTKILDAVKDKKWIEAKFLLSAPHDITTEIHLY